MAELIKESKQKFLSIVDKKIIKVLLNPDGRITSDNLAKVLRVSRTTIRRRCKLLENHFIQINYSLNLEKLGYRCIDLLITTQNGKTSAVAQELLKREEVVYVGRTVGQHEIDLKAEAIIKDNTDLMELFEIIKGFDGVKEVEWTEIVTVVGRKKSIPNGIINKL